MKIVIVGVGIFFLLTMLLACEKKPMEVKQSSNRDVSVELLFEHEGIKVFRFSEGGRFHYFTSKGETITCKTGLAGKIITHYDENIQ